ncbi:phosphotransferase [Paenibacillus qinlingensis]|uniref:Ser/Thr protein kinase RdoA (MazF antagonist) n=1 Tax=Paenibacillus qinlingensis TaxID=1837343 RepID=A0ABU1NZ02_9BACL|nr:phosphotransferase [Paenibacillus qinlingensis]MDR6552721.1 Ser/Thr protein kinase RdoA (MazF antagonist) [Paenibacillus qinlingensis]
MRVIEQEDQLALLPANWFPNQTWTLRVGAGGMNNTTRFVEVEDCTYVLRLYETHRDRNKINFEHRVLLQLAKRKDELPFDIPMPLELPTGGTVVTLGDDDGKLAALFTFTAGSNPIEIGLSQLKEMGKAAGQLSAALANISIADKPEYAPYYEIEHIHPSCKPDAIRAFAQHPPEAFLAQQEELAYIFNRYMALYSAIPTIRQLPHQLVHGDINGSNMLVDDEGRFVAILDFEFVTVDVRVMELAVCLSDLIDPSLPEEKLHANSKAFYEGYRQFVQLPQDEISILPLLIELRRLDVFIHFLGRYLDGVDPQGVLVDIIRNTYEKTKWLQTHKDLLRFDRM